MKKTLKIIGITLALILFVLFISVSAVVWVFFSPEKITPIVREQSAKFVNCEVNLEAVDLTFFSTFPHFALHLKNVSLINPTCGSPSDTLASISDLTATLDVKAFWETNSIVLNGFYLKNVAATIFVDSLGQPNYDVFRFQKDEEKDTSAFVNPFEQILLEVIEIENLKVRYLNRQSCIDVTLAPTDLSLRAEVKGKELDGKGKLNLKVAGLNCLLSDSVPIFANVQNIKIDIEGKKEKNQVSGELIIELPNTSFKMGDVEFVKEGDISLKLPFLALLDEMKLTLLKSELTFNHHQMELEGTAKHYENGAIAMDLDFATGTWNLKKIQTFIPQTYEKLLDGIDVDGDVKLTGKVSGIYNDSTLPLISANLFYSHGKLIYSGLPYQFRDILADIDAKLNLNKGVSSDLRINNLTLKTGESTASVSGTILDFMNIMRCNFRLRTNLNLPEVLPMLPKDMKVGLKGFANADLNTKFTLKQLLDMDLKHINAFGKIELSNLDVAYNDSMFLKTNKAALHLELPSLSKNFCFSQLLQLNIFSPELDAEMLNMGKVKLNNADLKIGVSNFLDTTRLMSLSCDFNMGSLFGNTDTMSIRVQNPHGKICMTPSTKNLKNPVLLCNYESENLSMNMGKQLFVDTKKIKVDANAEYDKNHNEVLLQWNPKVKVDFEKGNVKMANFPSMVQIPSIKFDFTPEKLIIQESGIVLEQSDFNLSGEVINIDQFMAKTGLLKADLDFVSNHTNVNQLMDLTSGFGNEKGDENITYRTEEEKKTDQEGDPFMVPLGVDIRLKTKIKNALIKETSIQNIGGTLTIKDGVLVLEQMGFTCDAAKMQLTAIYRSPRKNHLFAGFDFHLLDIEVDKLIKMVPDIDTIVPMLKSFAGKAEFHLAAETYMKSNYDLKMSTLRGSSAIEGKDLVVMDGETFSTIAKYLMFSKKTQNKVDTLSVEMTVFKNEVDIYPFLISMDNYKVVLEGRHNLDMTFNYHVETLAPIRLGLGIYGKFGDLKYKLKKPQYSDMYKPNRRNVMQTRTMSLKKLISDALKANVKEHPNEEE